MKKKKRNVSKKNRKRKKIKVINKLIVAISAFLFSGLMVLRSTYAWFVSESNETNHFVGSRLSAEIMEEFEPVTQWQPGTTAIKIIKIKNTGNIPAFVRISLYEYLLTFKVDTTDQTGNGNLATSPTEIHPIVDQKKTDTWQAAVTAGGTYLNEGNYFIANKAIVPNHLTGLEMYKFKDANREKTDLRWFQPIFPANVYDSAPQKETKNYWLYQDGYFYYSELLSPGELSQSVVTNVTLSERAPNKFKGALYQLNPSMDAHDATAALVSAWNLGDSSNVYNMYHDRLSD
ncbi:hypothetical protein DOK67_0001594 [Enterococcus sp. DIV0212c]|uniref:BsaA family SipW-dependent biofilm matrix protein n=1 Tax=Enterococcus sp. DIV0212c TaxID=2230867 RepID=UPI001A9B6F4E|nr:BsaA family SipW-dependent biofilm matrix protein [Enterococcus sp. DIV0212c]MBO1354200.1 hypothetical protein [Enterococcus sp. DIV0212c]